jgi:hypothetical protein
LVFDCEEKRRLILPGARRFLPRIARINTDYFAYAKNICPQISQKRTCINFCVPVLPWQNCIFAD